MELTQDLAYRELQQILQEKVLLVVGTGASMALDTRFGMGALREKLRDEIPTKISHDSDTKKQWEKVLNKLNKDGDLESALNVVKNGALIDAIIEVSGDFLSELDKELKLKFLGNEGEIPIEHFIQKLFNGLPEYDPVLDIITPNYDLLLEHCFDKLGIPYITGFWGGIRKQFNWEESIQQMVYTKSIPKGKKFVKVERTRGHIRLYKVHGSLNWFKFKRGGNYFEDNSLVYGKQNKNSVIERLIITPGEFKYEKAFLNTFDVIAKANEAVSGESAFIFIGYGFNDDHIQQNIKREIIEKNKPGIIITKELTKKTVDLLKESNNLWAVYQKKQDEDDKNVSNTQVFNAIYEKPLVIENSNIWEIKHFSREVLGD